MNCQEALDLLYDYIDKEASEIDAKEIQEHLSRCRNCFKIYRLESAVQELICERVKGDGDSPRLDNLKEKIVLKLDSIDRQSPPGHPPKSYSLVAKLLVAAASLVIVIGASSIAYRYYEHDKYYGALEASHEAVLSPDWKPSPEVGSAEFMGLDFSELGREQGFRLISSFDESLCNCSMRHLVFRDDERTVSVFAAASGDYKIPPECSDNVIKEGDNTFYCHKCHECRLLFHRVGNAVVVAASTDTDYDLRPFTPIEKAVLTSLGLP